MSADFVLTGCLCFLCGLIVYQFDRFHQLVIENRYQTFYLLAIYLNQLAQSF